MKINFRPSSRFNRPDEISLSIPGFRIFLYFYPVKMWSLKNFCLRVKPDERYSPFAFLTPWLDIDTQREF